MILVLLGPPGSGKGTQAKKLLADRRLAQLSTGDILRSAISEGTPLGQKAKTFMDQGALVPDSLMIDLISEKTQGPEYQNGYVLDGFPRTLPQARALDQLLASKGRNIGRVVSFEVDDAALVRRLEGRRTCVKCGAAFHIETLKPSQDGICDKCGAELIHRTDDREEVIRKRLEVYREQTAPLIEFYKAQSKLRVIDATLSPDRVWQQLTLALAD